MTGLRQAWRIPMYVAGAVALVSAINAGAWQAIVTISIGLAAMGAYMGWSYLEERRIARAVREIERNQERRRCA